LNETIRDTCGPASVSTQIPCATHLGTLLGRGKAVGVALTGGFQWAFWVCGMIAVLALPITAALFRRPPAAAIPAATEAVRSAAAR